MYRASPTHFYTPLQIPPPSTSSLCRARPPQPPPSTPSALQQRTLIDIRLVALSLCRARPPLPPPSTPSALQQRTLIDIRLVASSLRRARPPPPPPPFNNVHSLTQDLFPFSLINLGSGFHCLRSFSFFSGLLFASFLCRARPPLPPPSPTGSIALNHASSQGANGSLLNNALSAHLRSSFERGSGGSSSSGWALAGLQNPSGGS